MIKEALWYLNHGFSVIPVRKDKKPYIKWEKYQKEYATKEEVTGWFEKFPDAMVGVVTGKISNLAVIDIDTEEGFKAMGDILPDTLLTPTVTTPKGGQHLYFKNPDKSLSNNARTIPGCDFRGEGGYIVVPPSSNGNGKRYEFLDSLKIGQVALATLPDAYILAVKSFNSIKILDKGGGVSIEGAKKASKMFSDGRRDEDLFHVANHLVKSHMPDAEIFQVLKNLMLSWGEKPDTAWINAKIESALKRHNVRNKPITQDVEEIVEASEGIIWASNVLKELQELQAGASKASTRTVNQALRRLRDKGIIEKAGNQNGCWRIVDNACETIKYLEDTGKPIDIKYPFGIENHVFTMPKNIIVVAGEPNAGKTAFLLNIVAMNMDKHKIHYFSSEMGAMEMKTRLSKFGRPLDSWNFTPKERVSNFSDVIEPNAINIIDFLEVYDEFYKMGGMIKEVFDKLDKGIAIIAIQKNKGNEFGLGGMRGLEKARLYLTMEANKIKIVKGKNWVTQDNPNGMTKEFKLVQGCEFKDDPYWKQEID